MNINYVKKYSAALGRDMEYKTYGDKGHPVLVFPSQDGRFYDYQDFDMVGVLSGYIDRGLTPTEIRQFLRKAHGCELYFAADGDASPCQVQEQQCGKASK